MKVFAVIYDYIPNSAQGRSEKRPEHLSFLQQLHDAGTLLLSGPTDADGDHPGAILIVAAESARAAEQIMATDPFATAGFVKHQLREWTPRFGASRLQQ